MNVPSFDILPAPGPLKRDVVCFRIADYVGEEALSIKVSPNAVPGIVFQHENGASVIETIAHSGSHYIVPTFFVHGAGAFPSVMHFKRGSYVTIQVILKPHALHSLFRLNASTLTTGSIEGNDFADCDLNAQLIEATSNQKRVELLTRFLLTKLDQAPPHDRLIEEALHLIHADIACVSVNALCGSLHLSERQFERRFRHTVGLSPQTYIRVKRFNAAISLIKSRRYARLTDIAHALNYYDQSHLIRDINAFSNVTPKQLAQKTDDFYHDQIGYSTL